MNESSWQADLVQIEIYMIIITIVAKPFINLVGSHDLTSTEALRNTNPPDVH
jgi:hypothetical protein